MAGASHKILALSFALSFFSTTIVFSSRHQSNQLELRYIIMKLNYIMLPENFQPRPRPGHRVKNVSQTFSPMSMGGRRVQGEAKKTATVAGNAKKEVRAEEFTKFVKTLNKKVAAQRRAPPAAAGDVEADAAPRPMRTSDRRAAWLARSADAASSGSRLSRKREAAKSATEPICRRTDRRAKAEAMSSRVKLDDKPQPHNSVNQIQVVANVINANDTNQHQTLVGPTDARLDNGGTLYHQLPGVDTIHNQLPFDQHPVYGVIPPAFPHNVMAHQDVLFPGPGTHNHDYLELERTAIACANMGMDEPMDISPDFPSRVADYDYRDLERTAFACAYAAMDEPMDTTLDDTQGPMAYVVHQNIPPLIGFIGNPQEPQFDHAVTFQQPVYETLHPPDHQHLFDQEYHLWPPGYAHIPNQIVPLPHQELFVNENLPLGHYYQVGHYPQGEEYLGVLPEFAHNALIHPVVQQAFYEQGIIPVQQHPEIHHHHIGHAVHFHPAVQEERIDQGLLQHHPNGLVLEHDLGANWNAGGGWQHAREEGQHDGAGFFVDVFGENVGEQEEPNRHTGEARILDLFEQLFGDGGEDDEDDGGDDDDNEEENELQIII
ncbi:hypothetical protein JOM56_007787 [Amanita muscaria]